jgi:hypothetical protein
MKLTSRDRETTHLGVVLHCDTTGDAYVAVSYREGTYRVTLWARQFDDAESFDGVNPGPSSHCVVGSFHDYRWGHAAAAFSRAVRLLRPLASLDNDARRQLGSHYAAT